MFNRFTEKAKKVIILAKEAARRFNHDYIGTEHILLGLIHEGEEVAAVLEKMGMDLQTIRLEVEKVVQPGPTTQILGDIAFTPRAKRALELAAEEAWTMGHKHISAEHILLGIIRERESVASQVLLNLGLGLDRVRNEVQRVLGAATQGFGQRQPDRAYTKKGAFYTKLIKEISIAARQGGENPDMNPALRIAIIKAKEANIPSDNIKNAIKRGIGELSGVVYEPVTYEAYGPAEVAIMIEALTDNKNRTTTELRNILSKKGGNMASAGFVAWMFQKKGHIVIDKSAAKEDTLRHIALAAGAEDIKPQDKSYEVITSLQNFKKVESALEENGIRYQSAKITMFPTLTIKAVGPEAKQILSLVEVLVDHDDVYEVYTNFDISG